MESKKNKKCPFCFEEILFDAIKCNHCGEWINQEIKKETESNKFIFPAILSIFILGLGQFVKGEVKWGLLIWFWMISINIILGIFNLNLLNVIWTLGLWIYQISDAYNSPIKKS